MKKFVNHRLSFILAVGLAGCSNSSYNFSPAANNGNGAQNSPTNPSCSSHLTTLTTPAKFLFIVDMSGSNTAGDFGGPPTDPNKAARAGALQQFLTAYGSKANFSWSFFTFNDNSATPLTGGSFSNATAMQNAINAFKAMTDVGNTPYSTALSAASSALASDPMTSATKYMVVFISDGMPNPAASTNSLLSQVQTIVNRSPGQVTFNTVYYGDSNASAHDLMSSMASTGGGHFFDTNTSSSGKAFDIGNIIQIPGVDCAN